MRPPVGKDYQAFLSRIKRAVADGADWNGMIRFDWDTSARCSNPKAVEAFGRPEHSGVAQLDAQIRPLWLVQRVRCRQCENCLRFRAWLWRLRADTECRLAARTWLSTFTLTTESHYAFWCKAAIYERSQGFDIDSLDATAQFRARVKQISPELTKYLKRVRKGSGVPIRYILVVESHKSGLPHFHMLVHQVLPDRPLLKRHLQDVWPHGFSSFKLAEATSAGYVTKYLSKSMLARVRASMRYGKTLNDLTS